MRTRKRDTGVTLLEVVIASTILVIVVLIAMSIVFSSTSMATKGSLTSELEDRGRRFTEFCMTEFLQARFTGQITLGALPTNLGIDPLGSSPCNTSIAYQMPGSRDANGTDLGPGQALFGYLSPVPAASGFRQALACFIRFEADSVFKESAAAPNAAQLPDWGAPFPNYRALSAPVILNRDINKDGDQTDTFVRGKLKRYVLAPVGSPAYMANGTKCLLSAETLSDDVMLRVNPGAPTQFNWNMDGEAGAPPSQLDPLFLFVDPIGPDGTPITNANVATLGRGIAVTIWHGNWDENRKGFLIRKNSLTVRFRNTQ